MKALRVTILYLVVIIFCSSCSSPSLNAQTLLIEAESFSNTGGWVIDQQFMDQMGSPFLLAHGIGNPIADASTTVMFSQIGKYNVWVRTRDWVAPWKTPDTPLSKKANGTPGKFQLLIDSKPLDTTFGTQNANWHWQDGGPVNIKTNNITITLHDLTGFDGRCDAVIFSNDKDFTPPESLEELTELRIKTGVLSPITDAGSFDLVVVGGGIAGTCAAISATENGLTVALIQDRPVLGGNNSSEVRVWLNGETGFEPYPNVGNIVKKLEPAKRAHYGPQNSAELYEDDKRINFIRSYKNIDLFLNYHANMIIKDRNVITAVVAQNVVTGKRMRFNAPLFADCTGHGTIGFLAGADYDITLKQHMGRSNLFNVIDTGKAAPFPACPWALDLSKKSFPGRGDNPGIYGNKGLKALGSWFWESGFDHDPIEKGEYIRDWNFRAAYGAWDCLKNIDKVYPTHKLNWLAYISGPRESRRLLGEVILSEEDFYASTEFNDGCVPTSWSRDLHLPYKPYGKGFEGDEFISKDHHTKYNIPFWIPYRCLYSRNINNLFMAGRNISVTHEALGPVRVMRTTGMMGEIVGKAATICRKNDVSPRDVYKNHLNELKHLMRE